MADGTLQDIIDERRRELEAKDTADYATGNVPQPTEPLPPQSALPANGPQAVGVLVAPAVGLEDDSNLTFSQRVAIAQSQVPAGSRNAHGLANVQQRILNSPIQITKEVIRTIGQNLIVTGFSSAGALAQQAPDLLTIDGFLGKQFEETGEDQEAFLRKFVTAQQELAGRYSYIPESEEAQEIVTDIADTLETFLHLGGATNKLADWVTSDLEEQLREGSFTSDEQRNLAIQINALQGALAEDSLEIGLILLPLIPKTFAMRQAAFVRKRQRQSAKDFKDLQEGAAAEPVPGAKQIEGPEGTQIHPKPEVAPDVPLPGETLGITKFKVEALQDLPNAKLKFRNMEQFQLFKNDIRSGKQYSEIIVETVRGQPTKVISGQEALQALQIFARDKGLKIPEVTVRTQEVTSFSAAQRQSLNSALEEVRSNITQNENRLDASRKNQAGGLKRIAVTQAVDVQGNVKAAFIRTHEGTPEGWEAVKKLELIGGTSPKAALQFQQARAGIYGKRGADDGGIGTSKKFDIGDVSDDGKIRLKREHDLLDYLISARGIQSVGKTKAKKDIPSRPVITFENSPGAIELVRQQVGNKRFAQLQLRADEYFKTMKRLLDRAEESGLISSIAKHRMLLRDYVKADFIHEIDPPTRLMGPEGKPITVGESGIPYLGKGTKILPQRLDSEILLAEYIGRIEGRIAKNKANQAAVAFADAVPDNGFIMREQFKANGLPARRPKGMDEVKMRERGETKTLWMASALADEWMVGNSTYAIGIMNTFRVLNATFITKAMATGFNPSFAVTNMTRDIQLAWKATGAEYSNILPVYLGQMAADIKAVASDVAHKTGRYEDFINEGGGMSFLTHQGRDDLFVQSGLSSRQVQRQLGSGRGTVGRGWVKTKNALSFVNEFSELVVRLAIRERVLKNQTNKWLLKQKRPDGTNPYKEASPQLRQQMFDSAFEAKMGQIPEDATWIARRYLDFYQGGSAAKMLESFVPYTSASIQALRAEIRAYRKQGFPATPGVRPTGGRAKTAGRTAIKDAQLIGAKMSFNIYNWLAHPEAMSQIDIETQMNNIILPMDFFTMEDPWGIEDLRGNKRFFYGQLRMDSSVLPITAPFDMLAYKFFTGNAPDVHYVSTLSGMLPFLQGILPPTTAAGLAVFGNFDTWQNETIWGGDPNVPREQRFNPLTTSQFSQDFAKVMPYPLDSPVQNEIAFRALFPSNFYMGLTNQLSGSIMSMVSPTMTDRIQDKFQEDQSISDFTLEMLATQPGLNRIFRFTHPAANSEAIAQATLEEHAGITKKIQDQLNIGLAERRVLDSTVTLDKLRKDIRDNAPDKLLGLEMKIYSELLLDKIYKQEKYEYDFASKGFWVRAMNLDSRSRAVFFYNTWRQQNPGKNKTREAKQKDMERIGKRLSGLPGESFWTAVFDQEFKRLKEQGGNELADALFE